MLDIMRDLNHSSEYLWERCDGELRDPAEVAGHISLLRKPDSDLLDWEVRGPWWDIVASKAVTLICTREYEHHVIAMSVFNGRKRVTFMPLAHPSGVAFDSRRGRVYVTSTRNPNQLFEFAAVTASVRRRDAGDADVSGSPLVPVRSFFFPGCLYMHDLAMVGGRLHANAVGQNAVVRISDDGSYRRVWWPKCIETSSGPVFERNHIQLNSIAAGGSLGSSYFSASADVISGRRPGQRNFAVDGRGVIFSGKTRDVVARGLTRPHSARLHGKRVWVDNSGYGEVGYIEDGSLKVVARLPGWTRGLCFCDGIIFVGTSRIIERFRNYAPGLDSDECVCGIHAVEITSGRILASMIWPRGYQVFAVESVPVTFSAGFPFRFSRRARGKERDLFYAFSTDYS